MIDYLKDYDIVIGLEIHAELNCETKVFCACKNEFGAKPNTNTCPICLALPGALPLLSKRAVEQTIKAGLAFGCKISEYTFFERKNYFYPDLSKAYQISQMEKPLCIGGSVKLSSGKVVELNRIHLEEDAGKLTHISKAVGTLIDYNRGGVGLIELVTEPQISSADEAVEFAKKVRERLTFQNIANCFMEQGGMRVDVNLSLKRKGDSTLGVRTEMKNLNSFKSIKRAIEYETQRQAQALSMGEKIVKQTRKWHDDKGKSLAMRSKEEANDYRYFKDVDIKELKITKDEINEIKKQLVPSREERMEKYVKDFGLTEYDADILTTSKYISDYFETCVLTYYSPKSLANWIMMDLFSLVKQAEEWTFPISPEDLAIIAELVDKEQISKTLGQKLLEKTIQTGKSPKVLAEEDGLLVKISDDEIIEILQKFKQENKKAVADYKVDADKVEKFIVGYVMKATRGKANSTTVSKIIKELF